MDALKTILLGVLACHVALSQRPRKNNVCPSFRDYFTVEGNNNCWYDFAAESTVPEIIKKTGYPFMEYKIRTPDDYILTIFRIPNFNANKPPIFLLHGVQSTSGIFVGLGKRSIAFLLANAGYDVWLGNYRGTEYSEGHAYLNVTQKEYWDHSVDEIAKYDVPAMLELVNYHSGHTGKTIYIGHSLATAVAMMYSSEYPEQAANLVSLFIFIGPAYKMVHMRSPYRFLFPLFYPALEVTGALNVVQIVSRGHSRRLTGPTCLASPVIMAACVALVNTFIGPFTQIAPETLPVYFNQLPGGTSLKTLTFLRESTRGNFRKYDYGPGKNLHVYGSKIPPEYDIRKIKVPIFIIYAAQDWTTTKQDAINLYRQLPERAKYGIYGVERLNFNHLDYFFGTDSDQLITKPVLQVMERFLRTKSKCIRNFFGNMFYAVVVLVVSACGVLGVENNVCPTYDDYYTMRNNSNCFYDPSASHVAPDIISILGYPAQTYRIVTRDGYILTVFRIPNHGHPHAKKNPVYLQHGLVCTCNNFLALQRDSLALMLADEGYDVWLGNYRGTAYSEEHVNYTVRDEAFWDVSMDQVALIDLPAIFHTILTHTEGHHKIIYIGHSLGTTFALMYGAEFPDEAKDIMKMFVLLCPAYTLTNMISPYKYLAPYGNWILDTVRDLGLERLVSEGRELARLTIPLCMESPNLMQLCMQLYNLFYGPKADFGPEIIPVYFNQLPGGTSIKILNHAADLVLGNFRKYNYGKDNPRYYGTKEAPIFDIGRIEVPTYVVYSSGDWATPEADAINLWRHLPDQARLGIRKIDNKNFNHIDMIIGRHAREIAYEDLIRVVNNFAQRDD
ncbi:uncharacterized protein LOC132705123 [Cylas formicarius]|uniref:uncharacterized protein LOC132705123 n=1 Tax=Cylas formicarius TaxID=197179 RepID=UPI0029586483|nr:uncharacterized protein LOC132705123 [Cylas formicarius]